MECYDDRVRKIDIAVDIRGSFIPNDKPLASLWMRHLMQFELDFVFIEEGTKFLQLRPFHGLRVTQGDNYLYTCYRYCVKDRQGKNFSTSNAMIRCFNLSQMIAVIWSEAGLRMCSVPVAISPFFTIALDGQS